MKRAELIDDIAQRLKKIRKSRRFNRVQMANAVGISDSSYYKNERAVTSPDVLTFHQIATSLDISLDWLILGRGDMIYKPPVSVEELNQKETLVEIPSVEERLGPDVNELLEHMVHIPLLKYEVLTMFHKFKQRQKELVAEAMNSSSAGLGLDFQKA